MIAPPTRSLPRIPEPELITLAARAGFGANLRNTHLVKLLLFYKFIREELEK